MVDAPVAVGMRVVSSDGADLGLVESIDSGHFLVRDPDGEALRRFSYKDIRSVRSYVLLARPAKERPRRLIDRLRAARKRRRG